MAFSDLKVEVNLVKNPTTKIVAMASIIVDNTMRVGGFRVINGEKGPFVAAPSHKGTAKDDKGNTVEKWYEDVIFVDPKAGDKDFRTPAQEEAYTLILKEYARLREGGTVNRGSSAGAQNRIEKNASGKTSGARPSEDDPTYSW